MYNPYSSISSIYADIKKFPNNFATDYEVKCKTNFPEKIEEKLKDVEAAGKETLAEMENGTKKLIQTVIPVGFPPPKGKTPSNTIPQTFWQSLLKKIESIPNHSDIENMIIKGVGQSQCGLNSLNNLVDEQVEKYAMQCALFFEKADDIKGLEQEIISDILTLKSRSYITDGDIESAIHSRLITYKKNKDKKAESFITSAAKSLLDGIASFVMIILDKIIEITEPLVDFFKELFQDIVDVFENMMGAIAKRFENLIKPATPPTSLTDVLDWTLYVAKLFYGPIIDMTEQVVKFVIEVMPVVQALVKKVADTESLVLCCGPKIAATGGQPPSIIQHYVPDLDIDISQINMLGNPESMAKSAAATIAKKFQAANAEALEKTLRQDITKNLLGIDLAAIEKANKEAVLKAQNAAIEQSYDTAIANRKAAKKKQKQNKV